MILAIILVVLSISTQSQGNPEGAPVASCDDMVPRHIGDPNPYPSPYTLTAYVNGDGTYQGNVFNVYYKIKYVCSVIGRLILCKKLFGYFRI